MKASDFKVPFGPVRDQEEKVILLAPLYRGRRTSAGKHDPDPLKVTGFRTGKFVPGAIIERNGRRYVLQPDGSQHRIP